MRNAQKKRLYPRVIAEVSIASGATAHRCIVDVLGEGVAIRFERQPDGKIYKMGQEREPDGVERASDAGFYAALRLARTTMNAKLEKDKERIDRVHDNILVESAS